jgi:hypothetical protein
VLIGYQLLVHPLVVGGGKPLFEHNQRKVKLVSAKPFSSGVVLMTYQAHDPHLS